MMVCSWRVGFVGYIGGGVGGGGVGVGGGCG